MRNSVRAKGLTINNFCSCAFKEQIPRASSAECWQHLCRIMGNLILLFKPEENCFGEMHLIHDKDTTEHYELGGNTLFSSLIVAQGCYCFGRGWRAGCSPHQNLLKSFLMGINFPPVPVLTLTSQLQTHSIKNQNKSCTGVEHRGGTVGKLRVNVGEWLSTPVLNSEHLIKKKWCRNWVLLPYNFTWKWLDPLIFSLKKSQMSFGTKSYLQNLIHCTPERNYHKTTFPWRTKMSQEGDS